LGRQGDAVQFNPTLLEFAGHYRYEPRPVAPARGNEKGRVERAIRYVRDSVFAARTFTDLADLNAQAALWCNDQACDRICPANRELRVRQAFEHEQLQLLPLPDNPFNTDDVVAVHVGKTPYARFDLNDYSVPHAYVQRTVTVRATPDRAHPRRPHGDCRASTQLRSGRTDRRSKSHCRPRCAQAQSARSSRCQSPHQRGAG
jgi:hypothetical protein